MTILPNQDILKLRLQSNPSTGYRWQILSYDQAILNLNKTSYEASHIGLIGSPGYEIFEFKVLKHQQQTDIKLGYGRPWEKSSVKTQVIHVGIQ